MTDNYGNNKTNSVQIRLQRTTVEYGYVSVMIKPELITPDKHLNGAKTIQKAVDNSNLPGIIWYNEKQDVVAHPVQKARENSEESFFLD